MCQDNATTSIALATAPHRVNGRFARDDVPRDESTALKLVRGDNSNGATQPRTSGGRFTTSKREPELVLSTGGAEQYTLNSPSSRIAMEGFGSGVEHSASPLDTIADVACRMATGETLPSMTTNVRREERTTVAPLMKTLPNLCVAVSKDESLLKELWVAVQNTQRQMDEFAGEVQHLRQEVRRLRKGRVRVVVHADVLVQSGEGENGETEVMVWPRGGSKPEAAETERREVVHVEVNGEEHVLVEIEREGKNGDEQKEKMTGNKRSIDDVDGECQGGNKSGSTSTRVEGRHAKRAKMDGSASQKDEGGARAGSSEGKEKTTEQGRRSEASSTGDGAGRSMENVEKVDEEEGKENVDNEREKKVEVREGRRGSRRNGTAKRRRDNWSEYENGVFMRLVVDNTNMEEMDLRRMLAKHFSPRRTHEQCANHLRILRAQGKLPAAKDDGSINKMSGKRE